MAIMTAMELKLASKEPRLRRTLLIFSGHDEEVGGTEGASNAAKKLQTEGIELEFVLDEGGQTGSRPKCVGLDLNNP
jgi:carboxypeptidase PM20D1